jgi:hypothetical protein
MEAPVASGNVEVPSYVFKPVQSFARVVFHRLDGELGDLVESPELEDVAVVEGAEDCVEG